MSAADDAPRVAALARRVDGGARIVFVSTNAAEAERYTYCGVDGCPLDVLAVHDAREPDWHDRTPAVVRDLVALGARRGPRPVYLQEPQAWQDERAPDRVERFLDAAARASRAGAAAWTFHTRSAFILREGRSLASQVDAEERTVLERPAAARRRSASRPVSQPAAEGPRDPEKKRRPPRGSRRFEVVPMRATSWWRGRRGS